MKKGTKIWLWAALALSIGTTILNAREGRWLSVGIAIIAMIGLSILLFKEKKTGFYIMFLCAALSFGVGSYNGIVDGTNLAVAIGMSLIGASMIPAITYAFISKQWDTLNI
jgi:hypothetical protein